MVATIIGALLLLVIAGGVLFVMLVWKVYNRLITLRARYRTAYAQIDLQLQHRYELVSDLIETVQPSLPQARELLAAVTESRHRAAATMERASSAPGDPQAMRQIAAAEAQLTKALIQVLAALEQSPELQINQTISTLIEELRAIDEQLTLAQQTFNQAIATYNKERGAFPSNMVASSFNFNPAGQWPIQTNAPMAASSAVI
ncbi:MAG: LemA family protein [Leptolyngbya sp. SIO4C1]|nr:LemA family protein [Leptolyngbya sp. SIO4C1]